MNVNDKGRGNHMKTIALVSTLALSAVSACASSPGETEDGAIEVRRPGDQPVSGTAFTCSEHPATVLTPCDEFSRPQRGTGVRSAGPDTLEFLLSRSSNETDSGAVTAVLTLHLDGREVVRATALESTDFEAVDHNKKQLALDGWIEPVEVSLTPEGRNAGRFSLTFDWGTMSGTYDTAD